MALRFFGNAGSDNSSCPSVHLDDEDGSLVIVGWPEDSPGILAKIREVSHIEDFERAFRVPAELKKALWEACGGHDPHFG